MNPLIIFSTSIRLFSFQVTISGLYTSTVLGGVYLLMKRRIIWVPLHASVVWSGLNFSLGSAPEQKDSEEIKGGGHGEGSKREGTSLLYLNDTSVMLLQNKKKRGRVYEMNYQNEYFFHKHMNECAPISESHPWKYMYLNFYFS